MAEQEELEFGSEPSKPVEIDSAELKKLQDRAAELETKLSEAEIHKARLEERAAKATPAAAAPPARLTFEQLQEAVDNGQLSVAQMQQELRRQIEEDVEVKVSTKIRAEQTLAAQTKKVEDQFQAYLEWKPEIKKDGTPERKRLQDEYRELLELGYADDRRTEVMALRAVFGSADRVQETTRQRRETTRETGGAGGSLSQGGDDTSKWEKGLTNGQIAAYKQQISRGIYKGEDDPQFQRIVTRARTKNKAA